MKYLVTGGAGFIGSHIVDALVAQNHEVVVLDNLSSGHRENLSGSYERITFIEGDIRDPQTCMDAAAGCDGIFHEAALVSVADSVERPRDNHEINITGILNVLEAARGCGVKRVVFASSAAIYGNSPDLPKMEHMVPEPMSPYAVAKIAGEHYLRTYSELYGLECIALRYFNVYGPRQDPSSPYSGVISIFANRAQAGLLITVNGDGKQSRDFVNVVDVVSANLSAMNMDRTLIAQCSVSGGANSTSNSDSGFVVFNVASGRQHSLLELIKCLEGIMGKNINYEYGPARLGDIKYSSASTDKLQSIGWRSLVDFKTGLKGLHDCLL